MFMSSGVMKIVILLWTTLALSEASGNSNVTRTSRQAACEGKDEFRCTSGQCISKDLKCNGIPQCEDRSDETVDLCGNPSGTCILPPYPTNGKWNIVSGGTPSNRPGDYVPSVSIINLFCNGNHVMANDIRTQMVTAICVDGRWTRPSIRCISRSECVLPAHPSNGELKLLGTTKTYRVGDTVPNYSVLNFTCQENYIATETKVHYLIQCDNGHWSQYVSDSCKRICPPPPKKPNLKVTCSRDGSPVDCNMAIADTVASFNCEPFHESDQDLSLISNRRTCEDGSWNAPPIHCIPKCGVRGSDAETLIINGTDAIEGDWPWHVALYKIEGRGSSEKKDYVCGGTLISPYTILTAAHCVTSDEGVALPKTALMVAVGKHYRKFEDERDLKNHQISKLKELTVHKEYKGYKQNFRGDIAVLTTETAFDITRHVQPVCYDQSGIGDGDILSKPGKSGYVVGWGNTMEDGTPADSLKQVEVPYVPNDQCEKALPGDFDLYLTGDKICGGYLNKGTGVCKGDSGGGLVFKSQTRGRYFIRAIVSVAPKKKTGVCGSQYYSLYTRLHPYNLFIYQKSKLKP